MNDVSREKRWHDHFPRLFPRYALLACLALVVVSLGVALTPVRPPEPAEPSLSEQGRAAALTETRQLLAAGSRLGTGMQDASGPPATPAGGSAPAGNPAVQRTVSLLTAQAQALLAPGESAEVTPGASTSVPSASTPAAATAAPSSEASTAEASTAGTPASRLPATATELAAALADSGRQRLADAAEADGGMARLLAAVGTAQLLEASALAAGTGTAAPPPAAPFPEPSGTCPSGSARASNGSVAGDDSATARSVPDAGNAAGMKGASETNPAAASTDAAMAAVVRTEAETVYGYQVALPRLNGDAAKTAAEALARHEELLSGAESLSRRLCFAVPPREAGYALGQSFLASPAAGLGNLEAAALPVYGDLVALSNGDTRRWAITSLYDAGKRSMLWGADPGALPGVDSASLPPQPTPPTQSAG